MVGELLIAVCGAITGSFIALAASRYRPTLTTTEWGKQLITPPSCCPHCQHFLVMRDMIPLFSWLVYRGRCRYCNAHIGVSSLIIEALSVVLSILLCLIPDYKWWPALFCFTSLLILLAKIDIRYQLLPDILTQLLLWLGLLFNFWFESIRLSDALLGATGGYIALRMLAGAYYLLRHSEGLGLGDIKLIAAIGAWSGWQLLPLIITLSATLALSFTLISRRSKDNPLPFGPFLAIAGWLVVIIHSINEHFLL